MLARDHIPLPLARMLLFVGRAMTHRAAASERAVKFWRWYIIFSAIAVAAMALPAITTIPLEEDSLREVTRDSAVATVTAVADVLGAAYVSGKTAELQQQMADALRMYPMIVSALVTGSTGKVIAASDPKEEGKLLIDLFPPPVSAAAQWVGRGAGREAIEVTVPLKVNGELQGALRAVVVPPPVKTERWKEIGKTVALGGVLLGLLALAGTIRLRYRGRRHRSARQLPLQARGSVVQAGQRSENRREENKPQKESRDDVLRTALDLLPLAVMVVDDVSGVVSFANRAFYRLWGAEHLAARVQTGNLSYDDIAAHCRAQAGGSVPPLPERRVTSLDPDGSPTDISCADGRVLRRHSVPFSPEPGSKLACLYAFEDLTPNQDALTALGRARDAAEQASRRNAEFVATIASELRDSLCRLLGTIGLLPETSVDARQAEYAEAARESAASLLALVNGVHDLSAIEAGAPQPVIADFDLRTLLHETVASFAAAAQRKGLELLCAADEQLPRFVQGEAERLRRVLALLVSNAVRLAERGEILVRATVAGSPASAPAALHIGSDGSHRVRAHEPAPPPELVTVRFEVRDAGAGTVPAQQPQLSEIAAAPAQASPPKGAGMSLAVARRLIELMGGDVGVEIEPGQRSTFWFSLPLKVQQPAQAQERAVPEEAMAKARVLVVDDNTTARSLLQEQLRAWRIKSESAATAPEALDRLLGAARSGTPYSLVIIDAQMPEMDGVSLAKAIAREPKLANTPLFLLTAAGAPPSVMAEGPRIVATLPKPVRPSPLYDSLVGLLLRPATAEADASPAPAVQPTAPAAAPPAGCVLLAEDNLINQRIALRMLERLGYKTDVVVNGRQAVEAALRHRYDAILMDCQMPDMDGLTATQVIREHEGSERHTPIIAMTANAVEGDRERCIEAGMDDYLAKPVKVAELEESLRRCIRGRPVSAKTPLCDQASGRNGFAVV